MHQRKVGMWQRTGSGFGRFAFTAAALLVLFLISHNFSGGNPSKCRFAPEKAEFADSSSRSGGDAPVDSLAIEMHAEGETAPTPAEVPQPGFIIDKLEGGTLSLQDLRGRYVLLDF